jgi:tetratricopeptide (TPR) repeat protein
MSSDDDRDAAHWAAVEEAAEILVHGDYPGALTLLRAALEADPKNAYAYHYTGVAMFELKRYEPARDAYRAAVTMAPNYLAARVGLAHSERLAGDASAAVVAAEEAVERFPKDSDALYAAGLALAALGMRRKAKGLLQRFVASKPELEAQLEARSVIEMLALGHEGEPFRTG